MKEQFNTWKLAAVSLLLALMPLSFALPGRIKAVPAAGLLLLGLGLLLRRPVTRSTYAKAWPVVAVAILALVFAAINILGHGLGWAVFDNPSHILLFLLVAAAFTLPLPMRWVWLGFSLTAILLGAVCIAQHHLLDIPRVYGLNGGPWGAIEFAMVLLLLSLLAWVQVLFSSAGVMVRSLHAVGAVLAMYGALLTQSRGPLLAFVPMLMALLLIQALRRCSWRRSLLLAAGVVAGGIIACISVHGVVLDRFAQVGSEVASYDQHTDANGAVRERLEMWRVARLAFTTHPLTGVGLDQFGDYVRQQIAAGKANPAIGKYDYVHNEYLEAAATAGVPGLLVLLLVFGVPLVYFSRQVQHADISVMMPATAGLCVVGLYALCGLTDNVFYRPMPHSFYYFMVLGLAVLVGRRTMESEVATGG